MRIVVALGGNALLERGEVPSAEIQQRHVASAARALAPLAWDHDLVITHGNGPQVGLLALESASDPVLPYPYPFDVLSAQTQGMVGYWLLQALENVLPGHQVAALVCQTLVDATDRAFERPTKFVGPVYDECDAQLLARTRGWTVAQDGTAWRRVVASPEPRAVIEVPTIRTLLADGAVVICAGGGGIPVSRSAEGLLCGVDAVVDKDLTAALLARDLGADALLLLTDAAAVELHFGTPNACPIRRTNSEALRAQRFPAGSMGPKVDAVCRFVEATGHPAAIGRLSDAADLLVGTKGTLVEPSTARQSPMRGAPRPTSTDRTYRPAIPGSS